MSPASPTSPSESPPPDDAGDDAPASGRPTYRERKAESTALAGLAKALVEMKPSQLAEVPLSEDVREAVLVAQGLTRGPRVRQLRRVAQLLRVHDVSSIGAAAHDAGHKQRRRATRERGYEAWRERLVSEGDATLAEFVDQHPMADPQRLRQLLRQARRDPGSGKSKQARLGVLRLVREACEAEIGVARSAAEDAALDQSEGEGEGEDESAGADEGV
jgi:ribosome-associated protein